MEYEYESDDEFIEDLLEENEMDEENNAAQLKSELPEPLAVALPSEIIDRLLENIAYRMANSLMKKAEARMEEMLEKAFKMRMEAAMQSKMDAFISEYMARPRRKTNQYGEDIPGVASESFSEIVMKQWTGYLQEGVDRDGKSVGRDSYSRLATRLEWIIQKFAMENLVEESKKAAAQVSAEAKKVVQASVAQYIAEQLTPAVKVKPMQLKN